jgi:hypothetical protein
VLCLAVAAIGALWLQRYEAASFVAVALFGLFIGLVVAGLLVAGVRRVAGKMTPRIVAEALFFGGIGLVCYGALSLLFGGVANRQLSVVVTTVGVVALLTG